ncbi:zinc finger RNA-binding protein [Sorghum bicolor]|nr:zinc finger RNA-binding protein [Sorghum bicolor]|eukprot:XP_021301309.1 zinc finger RNA-binding protein [Sorghum bicolor]
MDYAAAATNAPAPAPAPGTDHAHYPHPYASYSYPYGAYHQPAPATYASVAAAASSSYYYPVPAAVPSTAVQYDPYSGYQHYSPPEGGGAAGAGLVGYYFTVGEAPQQAAVTSTTQAAPAATTKEAGKQFGFDPQRYAQAAVARACNGITQPAAAPGMHHAQWNAHFGHPVPKYALRKQMKKKPKALQPAPCEVCKIQCDTLEVLMIHKQGKKHKKNLEKLQDSITPKPIIKPPSNVIGPSMAPAAVSNCVVPCVLPKKKKSCSAETLEDLEVKKRRVLEAGAAQDEVRICGVCNVVVNSQKVFEFHIAGQKHQAMIQKQQALHFVT